MLRTAHCFARTLKRGGLTKKTMSMSTTEVLLFDLDGCLYPIDNGYVGNIRANIFEYMEKHAFVKDGESAEQTWKSLFKRYNQTLKGLKKSGFDVKDDEFWAYQRKDVAQFIKRDDKLKALLDSLPFKKVVFTNCNEVEARKCLALIGIEDCFSAVYGAKFMAPYCKPEKEAFEKLVTELQIPADHICFFEDSYKNLVTAKTMGMKTVLIESETAREENVTADGRAVLSAVISTMSDDGLELREKLPFLFDASAI